MNSSSFYVCFGLFFRELNEETGLQLNNILERQDQSTSTHQSLEIIETDLHLLELFDVNPDPGV